MYCVQEYDNNERSIHEYSLRGMYRDGAMLRSSSFLSKEWWISRRFFWERGLNEIPHCVVFVFDGSSDPFLDPESLDFFQTVFKDCTELGQFIFTPHNCQHVCMYIHVVTYLPPFFPFLSSFSFTHSLSLSSSSSSFPLSLSLSSLLPQDTSQ